MVDSREGSATTAVANRGHAGENSTRDVAGRLHLVLDPIRESLDAVGQNLSGLREKFAAMEATLGGLFAQTGNGHAGCAARLGDARRAIEELSASQEAGKRLRDDNAILRRDLQLQRGRQGIARSRPLFKFTL